MRRITLRPDRWDRIHWWYVRFHPTQEHMARAARKHHPHGADSWAGVIGCSQPIPLRERYNRRTREWETLLPKNGQLGIVRFVEGLVTPEVVAHELVHTAASTYRAMFGDLDLGDNCDDAEEKLAYIHGELFDSFEQQWHLIVDEAA